MSYDFIQLIILNTGILLILALTAGKFVSLMNIPKVTGYLLVGILLGPSVLGYFYPAYGNFILNKKILETYNIITQVGLGLIVFNIGGEFKLENVKKLGKNVFWISIFEIIFTTLSVLALSFIALKLFYPNFGDSTFIYAILFGVISIATAPAATLLVLREYESQGPLTNHILVLVGLNNIICIVVFKIMFSGFISEGHSFIMPILEVLASMLMGVIIGLIISFIEKSVEKPVELIMLATGGIAFNIGIAFIIEDIIHISNILSILFMGITMVNSSTKGDSTFKALKEVDLPIYAIFFVLAGANLHIDEFLNGGILFIVYVIGRAFGKIYGSFFGVKLSNMFKKLGNNIGYGLLPQAGVAIGLALIMKRDDPYMGGIMSSVILSAVMVFELIGPLFTRLAVIRSGEVKEISLSKRLSHKAKYRYLRVLARLRHSLGIQKWKKKRDKTILCKELMRSSVEAIHSDLAFDEVLKFASEYKYDQFPVIDEDNHFIGTISYQEIRDILLDIEFANLIIAQDMVDENPLVAYPSDSLKKLLMLFHDSKEELDYLPVIDEHKPPHLIGMVTQKDVIEVYRSLKDSNSLKEFDL